MRFTSSTLTRTPLRYSKLACALKLSLMATLTLPVVSNAFAAELSTSETNTLKSGSATTAPHNQQTRSFNIKAGPLNSALIAFAKQADIYISSDSVLTASKKNHKLKGNYSIEQALKQLLTGTALNFVKETNGSYRVVEAAPTGTLATAVVESADLKDGSAADGYLVEEITAVGPWQGRTLQQTPYSINVVSESLIQNLQATSPAQVYKIIPVIQLDTPEGTYGFSAAKMRGFSSRQVAHNGINNEKKSNADNIVMEQTAQIEVLTGLSGFFYGASNIGGTINYVSKKPTDERINKLTFGNTTGSNLYLHGDFGGQFDENGTFGYRLNVVTQDGDTHVDHQSLKRNSLGLVLDWQVTDDLLIAVNASKRDWQVDGRQAFWKMGNIESRPAAKDIDANKLWTQKWIYHELNGQRLGATIDWAINKNISWRSAYSTNETKRDMLYAFNTLKSNTSYNQRIFKTAPANFISSGGFSYLDINFNIGDIGHTLTTGWRFSKRNEHANELWKVGDITVDDLSTEKPTYITEPDWGNPDLGPVRDALNIDSNNFIIGDDIRFNQQWSALVGVSLVEVSVSDWWKADYKESAVTPTLSLIYQPLDNITTYASYSEGFEIGGVAENLHNAKNVINAGEVMGPLTSSQIEFGAKIDVNGILLTAALFEIDKGLEYYSAVNDKQYEFVQDGRQVHRGLEFTATGKLTENLSLVGGFTLLDAKTKEHKANPEMEGKRPRGIAEQLFKLYGEYNITAIPGLVINGGFNHTGSFYGNRMNTDKIAAYTLVDIGARYNLDLANKEVTLRLNINNLTDEKYWLSRKDLGERRTVSASVSVAF